MGSCPVVHPDRDLSLGHAAAIAFAEPSDHGSLEADLYATLLVTHRLMRHPLVRRILPDL
jgi:hypothetical protein